MSAVGFTNLESLEGRTLLSGAAAVLEHGVLRVRGNEHAANAIVVGNSADGLKVDVSVSFTRKNGVAKTLTASFPKTLTISKVRIAGGHLGDNISINQATSPFTIKTRIDGRGGNDTIVGGNEDDVISGGAGADNITAGAGNDLVYGQHGNDSLIGGDGNDTLWGGGGNDSVDGGNGDDVLGGIIDTNTLMGGAGKDTFWVKSLDKNPVNDFNSAEDILKTPKTKPHAKASDAA